MVREALLTGARAALRRRAPFLDFILEQVDIRESAAVPTARLCLAAPRFVLEYNPAYLGGLSLAEQAAVLEHEVLHLLHRHLERRGERDAARWNTACDLAINGAIANLPADALRPSRAQSGKTAERIYDLLPAGGAHHRACLADTVVDARLRGYLDGVHHWFASEARRRFRADLRRLLGAADLPGASGETVTPAGNLRVDWRRLLARHARPRARTPTLARPDRRGLSHWGRRRAYRARVVVAIDTSGSVTQTLGAAFVAELARLRAHCASLTVIMADAAVQRVLRFEELAGQGFSGRGGTDFEPAIAYVNAHLADHDLMIYLTDGDAAVPTLRAAIPLVWVVTQKRLFPGRPLVLAGEAA